jgi:GTPase SAR1 family protein
MIVRVTTGEFRPVVSSVHPARITKVLEVAGRRVQIELWDTARPKRYPSVGPLFFRDAAACLAVYDVADPQTLRALDGYLRDYRDCIETGGYIAVVANKVDLVDPDDALANGQKYVEAPRYPLFATSAKSRAGIDELFRHVAGGLAHAEVTELVASQLATEGDPPCRC